MNISSVLNRIKLDVGIYGIALPIDNVDDFLATVIKTITLPVFSVLHPKKRTDTVRLSELKVLDKTTEYIEYCFVGPNSSEVAFVEDIRSSSTSLIDGGYCGGVPCGRAAMSTESVILSNAAANVIDLLVPAPTFNFSTPNRLRLYGQYSDTVVIVYGLMHDVSLSSIPITASESFYKLAILDCKSALYNIVKHYSSLETAKGRIDLKIDDWADAASKREELINGWDDTYHLDQKTVYWA